ncbi:hypothetical protein [Pelagicoccus mobilis]|uniref:Uncharacterized protein n=1 Tax=Pelagicoccus mobilis TaxID=415221 RepID=A0A934VRN1_9BACT|nr:hypothetical protein [Pelagicoccus mobilis]MBK1877793.1 hypothetical protein [Pelagicoccus mobilis]
MNPRLHQIVGMEQLVQLKQVEDRTQNSDNLLSIEVRDLGKQLTFLREENKQLKQLLAERTLELEAQKLVNQQNWASF